MAGIAVLSALFTLVVTILWLVIGWRAMRAHERVADNLTTLSHHVRKIADSKEAAPARASSLGQTIDPSKLPRIRDDQP
ncbi:MAG: hypothetical protein K0R17_824 [Rariglobus sp.]|jgi:hypothetical protein|nr:hypothetical protein [Rariglobus sp.]